MPSWWPFGNQDKESDRVVLTKEAAEQFLGSLEQEWYSTRRALEDDEGEDNWYAINRRYDLTKSELDDDRDKIRETVETNPYLQRALRLYCIYVFGAEFQVGVKKKVMEAEETESDKEKEKKVKDLCKKAIYDALEENHGCWSPDELGKRAWRDGEAFTYIQDQQWPPKLRFIDPEDVGDPEGGEDEDSLGIVTDPEDVCTVLKYIRLDGEGNELTRYDPEEIEHVKLDVDSTEKRGRSRFQNLVETCKRLDHLSSVELKLRTVQASIAIVRKIAGGGSAARSFLDNQIDSSKTRNNFTFKREKIQAGSILTESKGHDIEFKQPTTNFSDATPLFALLIKQIASVTGWTYSMISSDSGEGNLANSIVAESPVHQMVIDERKFFRPALKRIFSRIVEAAFKNEDYKSEFSGLGYADPEAFWDEWEVNFTYGEVISRDLVKDAQAANLGVMMDAISRQEASRRIGADPDQMIKEIMEERELGLGNPNYANQNPDNQDAQASSQSNAQDGKGTNQGDQEPVQHNDNQGVGGSQNL